LRISVQLVETETRTQLWSDRHEGDVGDVFEFQDRIARQVAGAIHPAIRGAEIELARRRPTSSLRAYDFVMRAYPKLWGRRKETNDEAIELLRRAVAADPAYGRAHALLAWCHASRAVYLWSAEAGQELELALQAVDAAGSIGDDPTALTAAGSAMSMIGDQDRATSFIEKALALDPNNSWAWARFGWIGIYKGDNEKARDRFERAMALSPMDPLTFNMQLGFATSLAKSGSLDEAISIARNVIAAHPDNVMSYRYLAAWSAMNNDLDTARWAARKLLDSQPAFTIGRYRSLPFFSHTPEWADRVANALRLAGLPDC
jgi:tetratricopeptide (TPR) repeat protein